MAYPYQVPTRSFLQVGDQANELPESEFSPSGRTTLLALGSNAAPTVLARKLAAEAAADPIPVVRATLSDFDIVYSAHISAYGSIPAAIQASPGTEVSIHVLHLTDSQLKLMSETEPNYRLAVLHGVSCQLESGAHLSSVASYVSRHGCLAIDGSEVALESVSARDRRFRAMPERAVLEYVRSLLSPDQPMAEFIEENVRNDKLASERTRVLKEAANPLSWTSLDLLEN